MESFRIARIIKVRDTRQYEEGPDDRFHPIPGSGDQHECCRCGRLHEVHALVLLEDGREVIVGTGCAGRDSLDMAARFKSADSLAKRLAKLNAQEAAFQRKSARWIEARAEVEALPIPPITTGEEDDERFSMFVGDEGYARVFRRTLVTDPSYRAEREQCAIEGWREARMRERGQSRWAPRPPMDFAKKRRVIETALTKLAAPAGEVASISLS